MQLKIQRSQRTSTFGAVVFCLDVRADYSAEERENVRKYRLGSEVIYSSERAKRHLERAGAHLDRTQVGGVGERAAGLARGVASLAMARMSLNVSVASLAKGHHIECKDLEELLSAEDTLRDACKNVTRYLEAATTFNGSEVVIEYDRGEERVHVAQNAPPLIEYQPQTAGGPPPGQPGATQAIQPLDAQLQEFGAWLRVRWLPIEEKLVAFAKSKGWDVGADQVRVICGFAAFVVVVLFFVIV